MKIKLGFLVLGIILLSLPTISISGEQVSNNHPPPFVECRAESKCDNNVEELKRFLVDFYKWYVINEDGIFLPQHRNLSEKEHKKFHLKHEKNTNAVLKKYLTPSFYAWRKKVLSSEFDSGLKNPKYCSPDANAILCLQDFSYEWFSTMKIDVLKKNSKEALFYMTFTDHYEDSFKLIVTLKVKNNVWKIDAVNSDIFLNQHYTDK